MIISTQGKVYTSADAIVWKQIDTGPGAIGALTLRILAYGNGRWISNNSNDVFYSENGEKWNPIGSNLSSLIPLTHSIGGGVYANENFYILDCSDNNMPIFRSPDGKNWTRVTNIGQSIRNITYFDNKLYILTANGTQSYFGLFYPNDLQDSL